MLIVPSFLHAGPQLHIEKIKDTYSVVISDEDLAVVSSPNEGLWSIATEWNGDWPDNWRHAGPDTVLKSGSWTILTGSLDVSGGAWLLRDAYRKENDMIQCIRRFEWTGTDTLKNITLSVRWEVRGEKLQAFLPGILYYGNPSGEKNRPEWVPGYHGNPGEIALFEEHRYPMPFACLESGRDTIKFGASIHSIPSPLKDRNLPDHWWSMGVTAHDGYSELTLLSGPVAYNGMKSAAKALQSKPLKYGNTYLAVEPGTVIEKTFFIDLQKIDKEGTAFQRPVHTSLDIFKPYHADDLPAYKEILQAKYLFAKSRWMEGKGFAGFNMYGSNYSPHIVMGWCGQAASCGYALQNLREYFNDPDLHKMVQESLDFLSYSPVTEEGFPVRFDPKTGTWSDPDHVSMGQAMYNFAKAVEAAKSNGSWNYEKWEVFLKKACDFAAERILRPDWYPRSTAEAFYIAPLVIATSLFKEERYKDAAVKAAEHFAERHLSMREPYWGGTLDAQGEDKEGAWAALQGFLAVYELTGNEKYLEWAKHACDVVLSYTVVWDIPLPPGRLADHFFKTRGWTAVSPQNQHIDVFGVFFTPENYKMGKILNDENLEKLAEVMYRSCGQLIDPFGCQGEQLQETNYAQRGDMTDIYQLRGGYSESWTVFWITAHFLNAAARFEEMGVVLR